MAIYLDVGGGLVPPVTVLVEAEDDTFRVLWSILLSTHDDCLLTSSFAESSVVVVFEVSPTDDNVGWS